MRMPTLVSLQFLLLLVCACSCTNKPYPRNMQVADSIISSEPDSAISLLDQLKDRIASEPKATQMYYRLLSIKANDKAYVVHTSDSLILQVVSYYEQNKNDKHLAEAYYYAGRVYRDLGDAPQALDYFQKAAEGMEGKENYELLRRVYSQMGTLYLYQDIYEQALDAHKKAHHYNSILKDSTAIIFNLRDIGNAFTGCNNTDSALFYYQKAHKQAKLVGEQDFIDITQIGLAGLYRQLKKYDLAKEVLQLPSNNLTKKRQNAIFIILTNLYYEIGYLDSASYYSNQLLQIGTIYTKQTAHWMLAEIAQKQGSHQKALGHINQYIAYTKLVQKSTSSEGIRKMQALYNYQLRVKENNKLRLQNAQQEQWITYILLVCCILLASTAIYMQYNKRKKHELKEQLAKLKTIEDEQYKRSNKFIETNNLHIQDLEAQLESSAEQNSILRALLEAQKEQIIQTNCKISTDQREQELAEAAFRQSDIYSHFHAAVNDKSIKLLKESWTDLQIHIDRCYKNFSLRLRALYPVSSIELQICLLLKANITVTGVAVLTGRSKSAIVSARKSLYEKVHGEKGKPEQWDAFISTL